MLVSKPPDRCLVEGSQIDSLGSDPVRDMPRHVEVVLNGAGLVAEALEHGRELVEVLAEHARSEPRDDVGLPEDVFQHGGLLSGREWPGRTPHDDVDCDKPAALAGGDGAVTSPRRVARDASD
jgi:hypothetical protein